MNLKQKWIFYFLLFHIFSSCDNERYIVYIKIPYTATIAEKHKEKVLFRGVQVGEIREKLVLKDGNLLLKAVLERKNKYKFSDAFYREDLFGNSFVELSSKQPEILLDDTQYLDTIYGIYEPFYFKIDSASKKTILKEIGDLKNKLDSILEKK